MDSYSLLPDQSIKLEPTYETDHVHSSAREMAIEDEVSDMIDSNLSVRIKTELPEVEEEHSDQVKQTLNCSQNAASLPMQEHPQTEKMVTGNLGTKLVNQELSNDLCQDKLQWFRKMTDYGSERETGSHSNTVSSMNMNSCEAAQEYANYCNISEKVSSLFGENTKHSLVDNSLIDKSLIDKSFTDNSDHLQDTVETKSRDTEGMPDVCVESYSDKRRRRYATEKSYKCSDCSAAFALPYSLKKHMRSHTGERPFKCDDCDASFTDASNLKRHQRLHTGERPFKCDDCSACFTDTSNLKRHQKLHTGERPYKCDLCDASYFNPSHLKAHTRSHTGERPFVCAECGASFLIPGHLKAHTQIHTGEKHYKCDVCCTSFIKSSHLKVHMRVHTGEKPYKCDVCGASFSVATSLKRHRLTHTEEKPYKCTECASSFTKTGYLKTHMKKHKC